MAETLLSLIERDISDIVTSDEIKVNDNEKAVLADKEKENKDEGNNQKLELIPEKEIEKAKEIQNLEEIKSKEKKIENEITELYGKLCNLRRMREAKEKK